MTEMKGKPQLAFTPRVKFTGKGSFSISREKLIAQLDKERAKPPSPERDEMIAHMEGMLANMGES